MKMYIVQKYTEKMKNKNTHEMNELGLIDNVMRRRSSCRRRTKSTVDLISVHWTLV